MKVEEREILLHKIFIGEKHINIDGSVYIVRQPSILTKFQANKIYLDIINENKYNDWYTEESIVNLLISHGIWKNDGDKALSEINKRLEEKKISLYQDFGSLSKSENHRKEIRMIRRKIAELVNNRHQYDYLTLEGYAAFVKTQVLVSNSIYDQLGRQIENIPFPVLSKIIQIINGDNIRIEALRELARTDPWRSFYNINKDNTFGLSPVSLTEEQRTLLMFSKMYDSAYEHSECPDDDIIDDDDAFDGWICFQRNKNRSEKVNSKIDNLLTDKQKSSQEVFIFANNEKEANEIYKYNSPDALRTLKQRASIIKAKEEVTDSQLPDKKLELQMAANKNYIEHAKGK